MGLQEMLSANSVTELLLALDTTGLLFVLVLYATTTIFIIGWSYHKGIGSGLLVGGFFSFLVAFGMLLAGFVSMGAVIVPMCFFAIGALVEGFAVGKKDA